MSKSGTSSATASMGVIALAVGAAVLAEVLYLAVVWAAFLLQVMTVYFTFGDSPANGSETLSPLWWRTLPLLALLGALTVPLAAAWRILPPRSQFARVLIRCGTACFGGALGLIVGEISVAFYPQAASTDVFIVRLAVPLLLGLLAGALVPLRKKSQDTPLSDE